MAGAEGWRIVVSIGPAHPELRRDLAQIPERGRAERLRQLALLGLSGLRTAPVPSTPPELAKAPGPSPLDARRNKLMRGLGAEGED
jgi:predicted component of type VI protein secretion system